MFRHARSNRVFEDVVEQIQEAILEGKLEVGEKLPAERELQAMFHTSRGTLREALRVLEQRGLVEIKRGVSGGAIVKKISSEEMSESLALLIRSQKVSIAHLVEFRQDLEGMVAALAAQRATEQDIDTLNALLQEASIHLAAEDPEWEAFIQIDRQVHLELARITGNPLYKLILHTIHANIHRYYDLFLPKSAANRQEEYHNLCEIVQAVAEHNAERASELARAHIFRFANYTNKLESNDAKTN